MELYIKLFEVLFPVFFIVGIGYFLGKKNLIEISTPIPEKKPIAKTKRKNILLILKNIKCPYC